MYIDKREKSDIISNIVEFLIDNNKCLAKAIIINEFPHKTYEVEKRTYTIAQKLSAVCTISALPTGSAFLSNVTFGL